MSKVTAEDIAELDKLEGYKYPQPNTCDKCKHFDGNCTYYPREVWPTLWLTNQCPKFEQAMKG